MSSRSAMECGGKRSATPLFLMIGLFLTGSGTGATPLFLLIEPTPQFRTLFMKEDGTYWPHAPLHSFSERGVYMITAGTYQKEHRFNSPEKLTLLRDMLFKYTEQFEWQLQAWAVMNNHYHFVAVSPEDASTLKTMLSRLHEYSAKKLNRMDGVKGRKVWHNYWESHITHQTSYFARLRYVHQNPVHHGVVDNASNYPWCSQAWFERNSERSFVNTLARFKTDRINLSDDF